MVALEQPFFYNRLGAFNPEGKIYALKRDVVINDPLNPFDGVPLPQAEAAGGVAEPGKVLLRRDKRPRPIVLRMNVGDCLEVTFTNLLPPPPADPKDTEQPVTRHASVHVNGMQPVNDIDDDGSNVGLNASSLAAPGDTKVYKFYANAENTYLLYSLGATWGAEGTGGPLSFGLFGAVNVEPSNSEWYRSQVTHEEMVLVADANGNGAIDPAERTPTGQPIVDYDALYPNAPPFIAEGKANLPILNMQCNAAAAAAGACILDEIVHSDISAIITGPDRGPIDGGPQPGIKYGDPAIANPANDQTVDPVTGEQVRDRTAPFRESTVIFHDEIFAKQAFPEYFEDPVLQHTLHSVRDGFAINYGTGGIGAEVIANRLGVGPMWDCIDCKYEEFFLTSWAVGDPAMNVDIPANVGLTNCPPDCAAVGPKANKALWPADPSNVFHTYMNDNTKYRNLGAGPKEHHIFHLHTHQWLFSPLDDESTYLDFQAIGPSSGYTYDLVYGGSGNRNNTPGDAILHCHFYPHFAQGMWSHMRVHDVFEEGTVLEEEVDPNRANKPFALREATPIAGARALPDGEIPVGTPIPAVVPIPGKAMAPMPGAVHVQPLPNLPGSQIVIDEPDSDGDGIIDRNVGFPFFIAGIAGHRPPNPPLDMDLDFDLSAVVGGDPRPGFDGVAEGSGGLPRHRIQGPFGGNLDPLARQEVHTRLDFSKITKKAEIKELPETGTPAELGAMVAHAQRKHPTSVQPLKASDPVQPGQFVHNGQPPVTGAPYAEPCVDDDGARIEVGVDPYFLGETLKTPQTIEFGALNPRRYKAAVIQLDTIFNKVGSHFPQQRIITLWDDVAPTRSGERPPNPFVIRANTLDCVEYWLTNLVPHTYELDDFQVRTPTDVIGQHIHFVKFDVTSSDGAANGWNYEDGTLSPDEVVERIDAANAVGGMIPAGGTTPSVLLTPETHPKFGVDGVRTTIQRWFADPLLDNQGVDRGLGIVFTHDHFSPSTHQQAGLYGSLLIEPSGSTWRDNETGELLYNNAVRPSDDGGPTDWQAVIIPGPEAAEEPFREFHFEYADFQLAYEKEFDGDVSATSFLTAINPPVRMAANPVLPDLVLFPALCPGGVPRPCPEGISADDPGTYVVNYRNESIGRRIFDPNKVNPDGVVGGQADGQAGDLAFAFSSRTDRAIPELNDVQQACVRDSYVSPVARGTLLLGDDSAVPEMLIGPELACPQLTKDVQPGDPATPILRTYAGDNVRIKLQVGAQEEEHLTMVHGIKWLQEFAGPRSGWRNSQLKGIAEQFQLKFPLIADLGQRADSKGGDRADYIYTMDAANDGWWTGIWGLIRSYRVKRYDLTLLPNNPKPNPTIVNKDDFNGVCPKGAPIRYRDITAVRAADVLPGGTLVYNSRTDAFDDPFDPIDPVRNGPLHDPTALLYVLTEDLVVDAAGKPVGLKAGTPVEPLILRVNAGDCVDVTLRNALPDQVPDLDGFNAYVPVVDLDEGPNGKTTFNANRVRPSSHVGLHVQLLEYDITRSDGTNVGLNGGVQTAPPGGTVNYQWYAGDLRLQPVAYGLQTTANGLQAEAGGLFELVATPVEFGAVNLMPADKLEGTTKALVGALVVLPQGATWVEDPGTRAQATVTKADGTSYRDFVSVLQTNVNMRDAANNPIENIGAAGAGVPEDPQDAGQKAINYKTEPIWFRFGFDPDLAFGAQADIPGAEDTYSNALVGAEPETPIFTAAAGQPVRFHFVEAGGNARGHTITLHGHIWEREPYNQNPAIDGPDMIADNDTFIPECPPGVSGNCTSQWIGSQEGMGASNHFTLVPKHGAGGAFGVLGDYLYRMRDSFNNYTGIWGIFRVTPEVPLRADLESLTATAVGDNVTLRWKTITEVGKMGFNVWRSAQPEAGYQRVNSTLIPSQAGGMSGARYEFVDRRVPAGNWYYKLETISFAGQTDGWHGPASVRVGGTHGWQIYMPLVTHQHTSPQVSQSVWRSQSAGPAGVERQTEPQWFVQRRWGDRSRVGYGN